MLIPTSEEVMKEIMLDTSPIVSEWSTSEVA